MPSTDSLWLVNICLGLYCICLFAGCDGQDRDSVIIYLAGDSTMADYSNNYDPGKDYLKSRYPMTGWGQVFQELLDSTDIREVDLFGGKKPVKVDCRARGGRSTRTFFQEGRWRGIYDDLAPGDIVMIQFGHNDAAEQKPERYVNIEGYKEFLRLFVLQTRERGAIPVILSPVCRNYPWVDGKLQNVHGEYPQAAKDVADEARTFFIDLNRISMDAFSAKGREYVSKHYFLNLPAGKYEAYPNGLDDNTHFQPEGAQAVAQLVFDAMQGL